MIYTSKIVSTKELFGKLDNLILKFMLRNKGPRMLTIVLKQNVEEISPPGIKASNNYIVIKITYDMAQIEKNE